MSKGHQIFQTTKNSSRGFTIVELLIVIVVIGILAAITIVAYSGIQSRARDSDRKSDLASIVKVMNLYVVENGASPASASGCYVVRSWNGSFCEDFDNFSNLKFSTGKMPRDPLNTASSNYMYIKGYKPNATGTGITNGTGTDFVVIARLESSATATFTDIYGVGTYNYAVGSQ